MLHLTLATATAQNIRKALVYTHSKKCISVLLETVYF